MRTLVVLVVLVRIASAGASEALGTANRAFEAQDWATAAAVYRWWVEACPDDPRVGEAGMRWLDALNHLDRIDELTEVTNHLLVLRPNASGPIRQRLLALRARRIVAAVQTMLRVTGDSTEVLRLIAEPHSR